MSLLLFLSITDNVYEYRNFENYLVNCIKYIVNILFCIYGIKVQIFQTKNLVISLLCSHRGWK